jgi:hypothetical protein
MHSCAKLCKRCALLVSTQWCVALVAKQVQQVLAQKLSHGSAVMLRCPLLVALHLAEQ